MRIRSDSIHLAIHGCSTGGPTWDGVPLALPAKPANLLASRLRRPVEALLLLSIEGAEGNFGSPRF